MSDVADLGELNDVERDVIERATRMGDRERGIAIVRRARAFIPPTYIGVRHGDRDGILHFHCGTTTYDAADVAAKALHALRHQLGAMTMETNAKPDGVEIPFGHELTRVRDGEPLILIRAGATIQQRLEAGLHVVTACVKELLDRERSVQIDKAINSAAAAMVIIESVAVLLDEEAKMIESGSRATNRAEYRDRGTAGRLRKCAAELRSVMK